MPAPPLSPRARKRAAHLALAVPSLTLLAALGALLVGASPRALLAARVYGGPSRGPGPHSLRLACARYALGIEDPVAIEGLIVEIEGQALPASCDETGHADLALPPGLSLPERPPLVVRRGGLVLVRGTADIPTGVWQNSFSARPSRVPVATSPGPPPELLINGGVLAVGQGSRAWLRGRASPEGPPPRLLGRGADVGAPSVLEGGQGWAFDVKVTFLQASLSISSGVGPEGERWQAEASLPVIAGAPVVEALASEGGRLHAIVRSPSGREDAYARVVDREGRRYGARVPLTKRSPEGWPEGELSILAPPPDRPAWLVVSASVDGGPALGLPLPPSGEPRDGAFVPDVLWLDGLAPARAVETARLGRARWAVAALVASGALLEAWLLVWLQRARALIMNELADERLPLRPLGSGRLAIALGVVWLAFVIIGILLGAGLG